MKGMFDGMKEVQDSLKQQGQDENIFFKEEEDEYHQTREGGVGEHESGIDGTMEVK